MFYLFIVLLTYLIALEKMSSHLRMNEAFAEFAI